MKQRYLLLLFCLTASICMGQVGLRTSMLQYQMNALPLNPAYSSVEGATGFEATYLGNFISQGTVSRSIFLNMQGATEKGGLGLTFQFYRNNFAGEVNLRPAWSRRYYLQNGGEFSFGFVVGLNYFDVTNSFFSNNTDFVSFDLGTGVYYRNDRFFAGISILNIIEEAAGLGQTSNGLERENPYSLHVGGVLPLNQDLKIKPVALLRYINYYELPEQAFQTLERALSVDLQANIIIEDTYMVGALCGITNPNEGRNLLRLGVSATYLLGRFRLTYAFQNNSETNNATMLPVTHIISAGYDIGGAELDAPMRYF